MLYSFIQRAAVASLFICQISAAPQGRGDNDDTKVLDLPSPAEAQAQAAASAAATATPTPTHTSSTKAATSTAAPASKPKIAVAVDSKVVSSCQAIVYDLVGGGTRSSGVRIYQDGDLLADVNGIRACSMNIDSSLPYQVLVNTVADGPGAVKSCGGSYGSQSNLMGTVGGGYQNFKGLAAGGTSTCEMDFEC